MISNFVENILNNELEKIEERWEKSAEYNQIIKVYNESYAKVLNNLPKELAFKLIDELEGAFNSMCSAACKYHYKQGLKDGIDIFKKIKSFNIEDRKESISPVLRTVEIEKKYNEMIKNKVPTHVLNKEEYIYRKAFEEGRQEGYREAIH